MNKKQFAFVTFGIWGIISWIIAFFASDAQVQYVSGQIGEWIIIISFCGTLVLLLMIIGFGISKLYQMLGED